MVIPWCYARSDSIATGENITSWRSVSGIVVAGRTEVYYTLT